MAAAPGHGITDDRARVAAAPCGQLLGKVEEKTDPSRHRYGRPSKGTLS